MKNSVKHLRKEHLIKFSTSCIFAEFPLDPCDPLRSKEDEINSLIHAKDTRFVAFFDGLTLVKSADDITPMYFTHKDINEYVEGETIFLGKDDVQAYFAVNLVNKECLEGFGDFIDLRTIARTATKEGFSAIPSLLARGKMLLDWHSKHNFCAKCGTLSESGKGGYVRKCPACEAEHFPRVDPVVIMMITYGDKCLLGRSPHFVPGMYSALAGFMEPGETIEEAVRREVLEEAGIKVGEVSYVKSQPWPFPSSLMIGAIGKAMDDKINIENDELEEAKWFSKQEISNVIKTGGDEQFRVPEKLAIARHLLDHWLEED